MVQYRCLEERTAEGLKFSDRLKIGSSAQGGMVKLKLDQTIYQEVFDDLV